MSSQSYNYINKRFQKRQTINTTKYKESQLEVYRNSVAWNNLPPRVGIIESEEIINALYTRLEEVTMIY